MSEPPIGETDQSVAARIGVTILLLVFAVPFGHECARRFLDGDYLSAGIAFIIAVPLAVSAIIWAANSSLRARFSQFATNPWSWLAALSVLLLYFALPHIQFGREGPKGLPGAIGPQGPPGRPGQSAAADPRVNELLPRTAALQQEIAVLRSQLEASQMASPKPTEFDWRFARLQYLMQLQPKFQQQL
jgi:hypothetical protein